MSPSISEMKPTGPGSCTKPRIRKSCSMDRKRHSFPPLKRDERHPTPVADIATQPHDIQLVLDTPLSADVRGTQDPRVPVVAVQGFLKIVGVSTPQELQRLFSRARTTPRNGRGALTRTYTEPPGFIRKSPSGKRSTHIPRRTPDAGSRAAGRALRSLENIVSKAQAARPPEAPRDPFAGPMGLRKSTQEKASSNVPGSADFSQLSDAIGTVKFHSETSRGTRATLNLSPLKEHITYDKVKRAVMASPNEKGGPRNAAGPGRPAVSSKKVLSPTKKVSFPAKTVASLAKKVLVSPKKDSLSAKKNSPPTMKVLHPEEKVPPKIGVPLVLRARTIPKSEPRKLVSRKQLLVAETPAAVASPSGRRPYASFGDPLKTPSPTVRKTGAQRPVVHRSASVAKATAPVASPSPAVSSAIRGVQQKTLSRAISKTEAPKEILLTLVKPIAAVPAELNTDVSSQSRLASLTKATLPKKSRTSATAVSESKTPSAKVSPALNRPAEKLPAVKAMSTSGQVEVPEGRPVQSNSQRILLRGHQRVETIPSETQAMATVEGELSPLLHSKPEVSSPPKPADATEPLIQSARKSSLSKPSSRTGDAEKTTGSTQTKIEEAASGLPSDRVPAAIAELGKAALAVFQDIGDRFKLQTGDVGATAPSSPQSKTDGDDEQARKKVPVLDSVTLTLEGYASDPGDERADGKIRSSSTRLGSTDKTRPKKVAPRGAERLADINVELTAPSTEARNSNEEKRSKEARASTVTVRNRQAAAVQRLVTAKSKVEVAPAIRSHTAAPERKGTPTKYLPGRPGVATAPQQEGTSLTGLSPVLLEAGAKAFRSHASTGQTKSSSKMETVSRPAHTKLSSVDANGGTRRRSTVQEEASPQVKPAAAQSTREQEKIRTPFGRRASSQEVNVQRTQDARTVGPLKTPPNSERRKSIPTFSTGQEKAITSDGAIETKRIIAKKTALKKETPLLGRSGPEKIPIKTSVVGEAPARYGNVQTTLQLETTLPISLATNPEAGASRVYRKSATSLKAASSIDRQQKSPTEIFSDNLYSPQLAKTQVAQRRLRVKAQLPAEKGGMTRPQTTKLTQIGDIITMIQDKKGPIAADVAVNATTLTSSSHAHNSESQLRSQGAAGADDRFKTFQPASAGAAARNNSSLQHGRSSPLGAYVFREVSSASMAPFLVAPPKNLKAKLAEGKNASPTTLIAPDESKRVKSTGHMTKKDSGNIGRSLRANSPLLTLAKDDKGREWSSANAKGTPYTSPFIAPTGAQDESKVAESLPFREKSPILSDALGASPATKSSATTVEIPVDVDKVAHTSQLRQGKELLIDGGGQKTRLKKFPDSVAVKSVRTSDSFSRKNASQENSRRSFTQTVQESKATDETPALVVLDQYVAHRTGAAQSGKTRTAGPHLADRKTTNKSLLVAKTHAPKESGKPLVTKHVTEKDSSFGRRKISNTLSHGHTEMGTSQPTVSFPSTNVVGKEEHTAATHLLKFAPLGKLRLSRKISAASPDFTPCGMQRQNAPQKILSSSHSSTLPDRDERRQRNVSESSPPRSRSLPRTPSVPWVEKLLSQKTSEVRRSLSGTLSQQFSWIPPRAVTVGRTAQDGEFRNVEKVNRGSDHHVNQSKPLCKLASRTPTHAKLKATKTAAPAVAMSSAALNCATSFSSLIGRCASNEGVKEIVPNLMYLLLDRDQRRLRETHRPIRATQPLNNDASPTAEENASAQHPTGASTQDKTFVSSQRNIFGRDHVTFGTFTKSSSRECRILDQAVSMTFSSFDKALEKISSQATLGGQESDGLDTTSSNTIAASAPPSVFLPYTTEGWVNISVHAVPRCATLQRYSLPAFETIFPHDDNTAVVLRDAARTEQMTPWRLLVRKPSIATLRPYGKIPNHRTFRSQYQKQPLRT